MEKCEVCIFAKKDLDQHQKELVVHNYSFKYNPTPVMYADTRRWRLQNCFIYKGSEVNDSKHY